MPRSRARDMSFLVAIRRRWRAEEARAVLDRLDSSGLSVSEFAAREGLSAQRLHRWRKQLGREHTKGPAFVEITRSAATVPIEVVLHSGHVLRVSNGFGEDTLRRIVEVLEGRVSRC
jgi:transposase-like protein